MARTRAYVDGKLTDQDFAVEQLSEHLAAPGCVVWVDLCAPDRADLDLIGAELDLHHLAIEDATTEHERPKLSRYSSHLFLSAYQVRLDKTSGLLHTTRISAFCTSRALITVHDESFAIDDVVRRWDDSSDLAAHGVPFLLHALMDHVVDSHFDAVHTLDDEIEDLEDLLFDGGGHDSEVQRRTYRLRKSLVLLRRVVLPMREVVNSLMRRDLDVVDEAMAPYYQDLYDHVLRVTEWTESLRDLVTTAMETHLTIQGNRLNLTMKRVTSWAAIIAVPTAVTGFYGQNVPYPGFNHWSGFVMSTVIMIALSGGLWGLFRRRDWL
jgi:magnesium transporter